MAGFHDFLDQHALRRLDHMALSSRHAVEGGRAGRHKSPLKGSSIEFASHRNYTPGDNLRHLDWKIHGRSERLHIKEFQEETSLRVTLVLDSSASMAFSHDARPSKFHWARELAAACAYLTWQQQDALGLVVYDDEVRESRPPKSGTRHVLQILDSLQAREPRGRTHSGNALRTLAASLPRRGIIVMLSDLLDDPEAMFAALAHFRRRGNDVLLWQILDPAELTLPFESISEFIDMETGEHLEVDPLALRLAYQNALQNAIAECRHRCAALHVDFQLVSTDTQPIDFLLSCLTRRAR